MSAIKILVLSFCLFFNATASEIKGFNLPSNKSYLNLCQKNALAVYSGKIEKQVVLEMRHHFFVQYDIQITTNETRTVMCDLENGQLV